MKKLTIIHYLPISYYPPAMNLIEAIANRVSVAIITTMPQKGMLCYNSDKAEVQTLKNSNNGKLLRYLSDIWFVLYSVVKLIIRHPDAVLYYESNSALPVYIYKRFFNKKVSVRIHYHEYFTENDYKRPGMRISLFNHRLEQKWLYSHSCWVSHTNCKRAEMFLNDNPMIPKSIMHVFPNYPPKSWLRNMKVHTGDICKCVYIGSLSLESTFVLEFCQWVARQNGKATFDVYSFNFHKNTLAEVLKLNSPYIRFHSEGVDYDHIPELLDSYDVGTILYRAKSQNVKWCETNKFYEYLICGLDVWYPKQMLLLHEMDKNLFAPSIREIDFDNIDTFDCQLKSRSIDNSGYHWFADDVYNHFA